MADGGNAEGGVNPERPTLQNDSHQPDLEARLRRPKEKEIPTIEVDKISIEAKEEISEAEQKYRDKTTRLQRMLKLYFYSAAKYNKHQCSFHFIYFLFMVLQIVKLSCITAQMFQFGHERENFNSVVKRGHLTLKHLLLMGWDASWETPAYPPAHGDFAVYDIQNLKERINYAVEKLYNAEEDAIGYYKRPEFDSVKAEITYFDFGGFETGPTNHGLSVNTKSFTVQVESYTNQTTNGTVYTYDVDADFERNNLTEPVKRLLKFKLYFEIISVRVFIDRNKARCLNIKGEITFNDPDNNGQVVVDLDTKHERAICKDIGYDVPDVTFETVSTSFIVAILVLAFISLIYTLACMAFGVFVFLKTKRYMKDYYLKFFLPELEGIDSTELGEKDLPMGEYLRFIKGWDVLVLVADSTTIAGNLGLQKQTNESWTVESLDNVTILLGIGCLFSWIGLLRYFKFNYKFHLLFNTLYATILDVLAYLACICVLFVGYVTFGYVVLGPYHVKFQTPSSTAETLFSIINGDEIYATFALLQQDQTGGDLVPVFYKIYLGTFIAIFTIIILNLLIALFTNAYEAIKKEYEDPADPEEGPVENALKQLLVSRESQDHRLTDSVVNLLKSDKVKDKLSTGEINLKTQLHRIVGLSNSKENIVLKRPRTIKTFINTKLDKAGKGDNDDEKINYRCCCAVSWFFGCFGLDEKQCCLKQ